MEQGRWTVHGVTLGANRERRERATEGEETQSHREKRERGKMEEE